MCKIVGILLIFSVSSIIGSVIDGGETCGSKLLDDYIRIPDSAFSATSYFVPKDHLEKKSDFSAKAARMNYDRENQEFAWCPLSQVKTSLSEFLEIDLGRLTLLKVVQTKGRFAQGAGKEFTPFYRIRYIRDMKLGWRDYKILRNQKNWNLTLNGPKDAFLDVFETLKPPIIARKIRIIPYSVKRKRACLKLQLIGCDYDYNILEYRVPQGSILYGNESTVAVRRLYPSIFLQSSIIAPFIDWSYDGNEKIPKGYKIISNRDWPQLVDGVGLLTDLIRGNPGSLLDVVQHQSDYDTDTSSLPSRFMGWHRMRTSVREFVEIDFVFVNLRNFTHVTIYSLSDPFYRIEYFSSIEIYFSAHDVNMYTSHIDIKSALKKFNFTDHSIKINLNGRIGQYVKMKLYFHSNWLLISEIGFDSSAFSYKKIINNNIKEVTKNISNQKGMTYSVKPTIENGFNNQKKITTDLSNNQLHSTSKLKEGIMLTNSGLEVVYLLSILLCLLLGVIAAICIFWIVVRRRTHRRKTLKKQTLALCSQSSFIPYTGTTAGQPHPHARHHPTEQQKQHQAQQQQEQFIGNNGVGNTISSNNLVTVVSTNSYHSYTIDGRKFPNGSIRSISNLQSLYGRDIYDPNVKHNNQDNIYTSIMGSDNESTLSPEYASASITNDPAIVQHHVIGDNSATAVVAAARYLPPPLEPVRSPPTVQLPPITASSLNGYACPENMEQYNSGVTIIQSNTSQPSVTSQPTPTQAPPPPHPPSPPPPPPPPPSSAPSLSVLAPVSYMHQNQHPSLLGNGNKLTNTISSPTADNHRNVWSSTAVSPPHTSSGILVNNYSNPYSHQHLHQQQLSFNDYTQDVGNITQSQKYCGYQIHF